MTDEQIKHMANRFLVWKIPDSFSPDGGIKLDPIGNKGSAHEYRHQPVGTNLFTYTEAVAMVRHMVEGLPEDSPHPLPHNPDCAVHSTGSCDCGVYER